MQVNQGGLLLPRDSWWRSAVLKRARTRRKLTQEQLADLVGVHKIILSRLERGDRQPSMALLQRLAAKLKVKVADLVK